MEGYTLLLPTNPTACLMAFEQLFSLINGPQMFSLWKWSPTVSLMLLSVAVLSTSLFWHTQKTGQLSDIHSQQSCWSVATVVIWIVKHQQRGDPLTTNLKNKPNICYTSVFFYPNIELTASHVWHLFSTNAGHQSTIYSSGLHNVQIYLVLYLKVLNNWHI